MRVILAEPIINFDVSDASRFGELVLLFQHKVNPFQADLFLQFREALDDLQFNPDYDYICLTGRVAVLPILVSVVVSDWGVPIKVLIFDAVSATYKELEIDEPCFESV